MTVTVRVNEESLSSDLFILPEDVYTAEISTIVPKEKSKSSGLPLLWLSWVITSDPSEPINEDEYPDLQGTTVGKKVLESYSLSENAIWRLNSLYKVVTGNNLPTGQDFSLEEFTEMMKEALVGFVAKITLEQGEDQNDNPKMNVTGFAPVKQRASKSTKSAGRKKGKR